MLDALADFDIDQLDGRGMPSPYGPKASEWLMGTRISQIQESVEGLDAALIEEQTVEVPVAITRGIAQTGAGTWTAAAAANGVLTVGRAASATNGIFWIEVPLPFELLTGFKPTGLRCRYTVGTAIVDDVAVELHSKVPGSNSVVLCGDDNADYNAAENTAAERNAVATHSMVVSIPEDEQAYLTTTKRLLVRVFVDADAGGAGVFTLTDVTILGLTKRIASTELP